jgi:hypothetical protein
MNLGGFLVLKALVSLLFGLGYVAIPKTLMSWFGLALDPAGVVVTRTLGAVLLGIAMISWFTSQATQSRLSEDIVFSLFLADTAGFVVTVLAQLSPIGTTMGWVAAGIWLFLAAGLGYFRFLR